LAPGRTIAAFLPELADPVDRKVSDGVGLGYLGGLLSLGLCLRTSLLVSQRGVPTDLAVPHTMLITAGLFALASVPTFLILKERVKPQPGVGHIFQDTFGRLGQTLRRAREYQDLWRFLVCIVFYQAGIQAVITLAAIYAEQAMGFKTKETLLLLLVTNVTGSIGALLFGRQDRISHKATLAINLVLDGDRSAGVGGAGRRSSGSRQLVASAWRQSINGPRLIGFLSPEARRCSLVCGDSR
jgi:UMF1 family MFS transporter